MSSRTPAAGSRASATGGGGGGRRRAGASGAASTPRHVRMIQEHLARAREEERCAEERRREEEARRAEEERRAAEEAERRAEEEARAREERRRRRQEDARKRAEWEEKRRMEDARRRLGVAGAGAGGSCADEAAQKRPVYESRKAKSQPKRHENAQSKADLGETRGLQLLEEQSNASSEDDGKVADALEFVEKQITGSSLEEDSGIDDDDDDSWDKKNLDEFDAVVRGKPLCFGVKEDEETEENQETFAALTTNSINVADDIDRVEVSIPHDEGSADGIHRELRAPICCILGHVDAGKTKLLDCIRRSNVQGGEAGGITQQIGATYLPAENIRERTSLKAEATIKVPGLLVIDTPGHQSFSNMRLRGSRLCDIAVLVVDITRGLEMQTIESLDLLKQRDVRFIVALNKVDRLYGWKTLPDAPIVKALRNQCDDVRREFKWRVTEVVTQLMENGFNAALYYENKKMKEVVNIVPTSSVSGEGIPDLLLLLVRWVPETMLEKLTYVDTVECTVLEVNEHKDFGTTIDVVLINGALRKGDRIVVCTKQGPVTTSIRYLLTPCPMKELKVKGVYKHHEELKAAQGVKVAVRGVQHAMAGTPLIVLKPGNDVEQAEAAAMNEISMAISLINENGRGDNNDGTAVQETSSIKTCREGVYVQASSLGTLEAIIEHLKTLPLDIPVSGCNLGPLHKQDVMKASVMLKRREEYAAILAFDVKVMPEAFEFAAESGVKIFVADTVYKLVDSFTDHLTKLKEEKKKYAADAVFPCTLKIIPNHVYHSKDPIVCDVEVVEGVVKVGTPICVSVLSKDASVDIIHSLGRISSIKTLNGVEIDSAKEGAVSIKIIGENAQERSRLYGRHFNASHELLSQISRKSIDVLKEYYRDEMSDENWQLICRLKKQLGIP